MSIGEGLGGDDYGEAPPPIGHNAPPKTYADEIREEHAPLFVRFEALELARARLPAKVETEADLEKVGAFVKTARDLEKDAKAAHRKGSEAVKVKAKTWDTLFLTGGICGKVDGLKDVAQALADDYTARKEVARREALAREAERLRELQGEHLYEAQAYDEAGVHAAAEVVESQSEHIGKAADRAEQKSQGSAADVVRTRFETVTASGRTVWAYEIEDFEKIDFNLLKKVFFDHEIDQVLQRFVQRGGRELPGVRIFERTVSTFR